MEGRILSRKIIYPQSQPPPTPEPGQAETTTVTVPPSPLPTDFGEGVPIGGGRVNLGRKRGRLI